MSHPRVEEVSDSGSGSDPAEADVDDFLDTHILQRRPAPPRAGPGPGPGPVPGPAAAVSPAEQQAYRAFQSLYPVYFDAGRTRAEGRRVGAALAVANPLAREVAAACSRLGLRTLLEPDKTHPKDWANPGRVKVGLRPAQAAGAGGGGGQQIRNKHHLYRLVAAHLRAHPTTEASPGLRVRVGGQLQPPEGEPYPRPAVPRGWKVGALLPYLSAAMTGGGVSENLFRDMMREMQGGPAADEAAEEAPRRRREKKGKGKA